MFNSFVTPWTVAHQTLLFMGFSRQEYWGELPFPSPADLLDPGIKPLSLALVADPLHWATKEAPNGILLSHKKEKNCAICRDVDGPRVCHTQWSKSEREKQILYIDVYMWNLEKWYRWTYFKGKNRDADIENRQMNMEAEGKGRMGLTGRLGLPYIHYHV